MIGNTIVYRKYERSSYGGTDWTSNPTEQEAIVVDAYTKITGSTKGETVFGFGQTEGRTSSDRMYKVQYFGKWDDEKEHPFYEDIYATQFIRVVHFATLPASEEKIK